MLSTSTAQRARPLLQSSSVFEPEPGLALHSIPHGTTLESIYCLGSTCVGEAGTATCVPYLPPGASCDATAGASCAPSSRCLGAVCTKTDAANCR